MTKTYTLWARVGMAVEMSEKDAARFEDDPEGFFKRAIKDGRVSVDGDVYFPDIEENAKYAKATGLPLD